IIPPLYSSRAPSSCSIKGSFPHLHRCPVSLPLPLARLLEHIVPPYSNPHGGAPPPGGKRSNVLAQPPMSTRILLCALSLPLRRDPLPKSTPFLFQGHLP
ncbi:hypothetical protein M91_04884, partial [Bos mutus]